MKLFGKIKGFYNKNEANINLACGITLGLVGTVLACKATLKVDTINVETKDTIERIRAAEVDENTEYSSDDAKNDIKTLGIKTAVKVAKTYLPSALCMVAGGALIIRSHNILVNKVSELEDKVGEITAALLLTQQAFDKYRQNVRTVYGDEVDNNFMTKEYTKELKVDENGNAKEVISEKDAKFGYTIVWSGDTSKKFSEYNESNRVMIDGVTKYFDNLFREGKRKGDVITLRELYQYFGMYDIDGALTDWQKKAALVCGWRKDDDPNSDKFINLKVRPFRWDPDREIDGYYIDFNCSYIYDRM